jgi:hypothetical protein
MKRNTEKNDPKAINSTEKGVTFLCRILTGVSHFYVEKLPLGQYSTGSFFYNLHGEKLPQGRKFYGKASHFSP